MKKFVIKIIKLNGEKRRLTFKAPRGKLITERGVEDTLAQVCHTLDTNFPDCAFRLVPLISGNFSIIEISKEQAIKHIEQRVIDGEGPSGFQPTGLLDAKCSA